jgi:hypothetical protein
MRVRVSFRYRADTGEVEVFQVDHIESGSRTADHDAHHERIAAELGRVVEHNAVVEQVAGGPVVPRPAPVPLTDESAQPEGQQLRD